MEPPGARTNRAQRELDEGHEYPKPGLAATEVLPKHQERVPKL